MFTAIRIYTELNISYYFLTAIFFISLSDRLKKH